MLDAMSGGLTVSDWLGIGAMVVSIIGGALAMAWRLGILSNKVDDNTKRIDKMDQRIDTLANRGMVGGRRWTDPHPYWPPRPEEPKQE